MMTRILTRGYLWLLLALLYSPILIIMAFSFTEAKVLGNWTGFSTKLYSSLFMGGMHHSLMNAIWKYAPMYAAAYNAQEQAGLHDGLGILLKMMGEDSEPQGSPEHMISLVPDTGTEFIGFWK